MEVVIDKKLKVECIAITGNLNALTHNEAVKAIHIAGFTYAINIDNSTTHCVAGTDPDAGMVLEAQNHNLEIITEGAFLRIIADRLSRRKVE
jgi:NAD-dependent DNA ligase